MLDPGLPGCKQRSRAALVLWDLHHPMEGRLYTGRLWTGLVGLMGSIWDPTQGVRGGQQHCHQFQNVIHVAGRGMAGEGAGWCWPWQHLHTGSPFRQQEQVHA